MQDETRPWLTLAEALKILGIAKGKFYELVEGGQIGSKPSKRGGKHQVYSPDDVEAMKLALDQAFGQEPSLVFSRSTAGEQRQEMHIGIRCFGEEYITPLAERIAFQQKSEMTFWSLKLKDRVLGYISMFRFPPEFLNDILTGDRIEREITVKEVLPFTRGEDFDIYIDVMAMDPLLTHHQQEYYGGVMASRFANEILNLLANRYQVRNIYTVTATPEGDRLVQGAGFHLLEGKSRKPGRIAYIFPLDEEGRARLKYLASINRRILR